MKEGSENQESGENQTSNTPFGGIDKATDLPNLNIEVYGIKTIKVFPNCVTSG